MLKSIDQILSPGCSSTSGGFLQVRPPSDVTNTDPSSPAIRPTLPSVLKSIDQILSPGCSSTSGGFLQVRPPSDVTNTDPSSPAIRPTLSSVLKSIDQILSLGCRSISGCCLQVCSPSDVTNTNTDIMSTAYQSKLSSGSANIPCGTELSGTSTQRRPSTRESSVSPYCVFINSRAARSRSLDSICGTTNSIR